MAGWLVRGGGVGLGVVEVEMGGPGMVAVGKGLGMGFQGVIQKTCCQNYLAASLFNVV